jgi:hypothetical protein
MGYMGRDAASESVDGGIGNGELRIENSRFQNARKRLKAEDKKRGVLVRGGLPRRVLLLAGLDFT